MKNFIAGQWLDKPKKNEVTNPFNNSVIDAEPRGEAAGAAETMTGSAEEAKRLHGETVPLDADPTGSKKLGFTLRVPCGVVAAIAPFNFPLNLVTHKVGPALAAGHTVIIK